MNELPNDINELDAEQKERFIKAMDEATNKQKEFLEEYRKLCKKYSYDFIATPVLIAPTGKELEGSKLTKVMKSINRILFQEHVGLRATFRLIPKQENGTDTQ